MKIAHISDTHVGYYAYGKTAQGRINQREADVVDAFKRCLKAVEERDPDLVLHSGDFFHVVRPSNYSLIAAYKLLASFQARRMGKPFVIIGGNHDTPQSAESTNILRLFEDIEGVYVETETARLLEVGEASVLCLPNKSMRAKENASWAPPKCKFPVLLLHGLALETKLERFDFEVKEARADEWAYVGMGDFHIHQPYGRNICYAGSTEFTSTNIWEESTRPKGWVWFDTEVGALEFVPLKTRPVVDLPVIDALDLTAEDLGSQLLGNAQWTFEDLPIVRQVVLNVHQETRRELDLELVRSIDARALYYRLALQPPMVHAAGLTRAGQASSLESCWESHIDKTPLAAGVDKAAVKLRGLELLQEVAELETAPAEA